MNRRNKYEIVPEDVNCVLHITVRGGLWAYNSKRNEHNKQAVYPNQP